MVLELTAAKTGSITLYVCIDYPSKQLPRHALLLVLSNLFGHYSTEQTHIHFEKEAVTYQLGFFLFLFEACSLYLCRSPRCLLLSYKKQLLVISKSNCLMLLSNWEYM